MKKLFIAIAIVLVTMSVASTSFALSYRNNCAHNVIGDINDDGVTNILDFSLLSVAFNSRLGDANFSKAADLTCDRVINEDDFSIFKAGYGLTPS